MPAQPAVMGPVTVGRGAQGECPQAQPSFGQNLADAGQLVVQQAAPQPVGGQQGARQQAQPRVFNGGSFLDTPRYQGDETMTIRLKAFCHLLDATNKSRFFSTTWNKRS